MRFCFSVRFWPVALLLLATACERRKSVVIYSPASMKQLEGTWLSSREEDSGDTLVYRPNTYHFPSSRGRPGFAFKSYGRFEQFNIAPTDGLAGYPGTWVIDGSKLNKIRIHLNEGQEPDYDLEVFSLKNKVLKLRKLPAGKP
ncbi:lipocalin family protein [Hymenobacter sp. BT439]|uniref:Lipocalin family protein n=2 Tax=Hymenobacter properus TaxID=2791026 RepID=A0A931BM67_9BACT|nr:lipocalin family protein [Hymenobacter properus]